MATYKDINLIPGNTSNNLKLWYKMDEISGYLITDSSGNDYNGQIYDSCVSDTAGKINTALVLNGSICIVTYQNFQTIFRNNFTVNCWVKLTDGINSNQQSIFNSSLYDISNFDFWIESGYLKARYTTDDYSISSSTETTFFPDNDWVMATVVLHYDNNVLSMSLYVNGVSITGDELEVISMSSYSNENLAQIGGNGEYEGEFFLTGSLDNFMLFNKALTSREILDLYNYDFFIKSNSIKEVDGKLNN
jgi:hypothetical protein